MAEEKKWKALLKYDPLGNRITKYQRWRSHTPLGEVFVIVALACPILFFYVDSTDAVFYSVDYFTIFFGLITLLFLYVQIQINTNLLEAEKNRSARDFVLAYYTELRREFKKLDDVYLYLQMGVYDNSIRVLLPTFLRMESTAMLKSIQEMDKDLIQPFRKLLQDIIPAISELEVQRACKKKNLPTRWRTALDEIEEWKSFPESEKEYILSALQGFQQNFWKKELKLSKKLFEQSVTVHNDDAHKYADRRDNVRPIISPTLSAKLFDKICDISSEDLGPIRKKLMEKGEELKDEITNKIIPILDKRMVSVIRGFSS